MDDGGAVGKHRGRPLQEGQRRERLEIRRVAVEIDVIGALRQSDLHRLERPISENANLVFERPQAGK